MVPDFFEMPTISWNSLRAFVLRVDKCIISILERKRGGARQGGGGARQGGIDNDLTWNDSECSLL